MHPARPYPSRSIRSLLLLASVLAATAGVAFAAGVPQEAAIRKNISERLPNFPKIDEVSKTPMPGLIELRSGADLYYTDTAGDFVMQGDLIDTKTKSSITQARVAKLTQVDYASLPFQDAFAIKQGTGARQVVVFADPNCGYCKKLERDLVQLKDATVNTFLIPILGGDSPEKTRDIWCSKDVGATWREWMLNGKLPPRAAVECDVSAIQRNLALSVKYKVRGTPAIVYEDGTRSPGAVTLEEIERKLSSQAPAKGRP